MTYIDGPKYRPEQPYDGHRPIGYLVNEPSLEQRIEALERLVGVLSMELRELKDA